MVTKAAEAGAVGVIIVNTQDDLEQMTDSGSSSIPVLIIKSSDAVRLREHGGALIRDAGAPCLADGLYREDDPRLRIVRVKKYPVIAAAGQSYAVPLQPQLAPPPTTVRFEPRTDVHMIKASDAVRLRESGCALIRDKAMGDLRVRVAPVTARGAPAPAAPTGSWFDEGIVGAVTLRPQ